MLAFALFGSLSTVGASQPEPAALTLADDKLRVRDLARGAVRGELVVAALPAHAARVTLSEEQRAALLRKRVPGMRFSLRHKGDVQFNRGSAGMAAISETSCFSARTDIPAGVYLRAEHVASAPCSAGVPARRLRYDPAAAAAYAQALIPAGSYLGRLRLPEVPPVPAGQSMLLQTRVGPVTIERGVTALQPGRPGRSLFVRTDDGKLLASRLVAPKGEVSK